MEKELLSLRPKRFLCPFCGKWHEWELEHELSYYSSVAFPAALECASRRVGYSERRMRFHFTDGKCYYRTFPSCGKAALELNGSISVDNIVESSSKPQVTFDVLFTPESCIGDSACCDCGSRDYNCQLVKLADAGDWRQITLKLGFEFEQNEYDKYAKAAILARKEHENVVKVKEQSKEGTTMNNFFNMNMEFGPNKDNNIASTMMGIAIKNGDSWRIYDKKKKEITDVGDMQLGNLPLFIMPTTKLNEGDLIKDGGEYYYVVKVDTGYTQTLCAKTGEMKTVIPIKNILGFSCYSKVIALSDYINTGDNFDVEKLALMSAMCGQPGQNINQMNQLVPLMLFKDKLGGDDHMMKMMFMSSMMSGNVEADGQNATMNQLLPFMLLKDKDGGDENMMKMFFMSSMMGGNNEGNNPLMSYMILEMLRGEKKDEKTSQSAQTPAANTGE